MLYSLPMRPAQRMASLRPISVQAGYLDHALASSSMAGRVTDASIWHVNADEPSVLDYDTEHKSAGRVKACTRRTSTAPLTRPVIADLERGGESIYLPAVMRGNPGP